MERRKITTKLSVSPSFSVPNGAVAGDFSSQIVGDNFSDPKREPILLHLSPIKNEAQSTYELRPLPDLLSLEHPVPDPIVDTLPYPPLSIISGDLVPVIESSNKRFRTSPIYSPPPFSFQGVNPNPIPFFRSQKPPSSEIARRRRSKICERINILEGLMPWDQKMTKGTMLEEAHKYIRFLEAQVTALQTMPVQVAMFGMVGVDQNGRFGGLEMLNRQQMLQVMVNSAMVQSFLYKKGCCVFSAEQVAEFRQNVVEGWSPVMMLTGSSSVSR